MGQKTSRFGPPVSGYGSNRAPRGAKEDTVNTNNFGLIALLLLFILLVETAYVVHVW